MRMKKNKRFLLVVMTILFITSLLGCAKEGEDIDVAKIEEVNVETEAVAVENEEVVLRIGLFWLSSDLEPTTKWNGWNLARLGIGQNLVQVDENMEFIPVVAESWEVIDEKTMIFNIREGIKFHDGTEVTAQSVKKSIERALEISGREDVKFPVESIVAEGQKLTISTTKPYSILLNNLADPVYTIVTGFDKDNFAIKPISTGPFKVEKFDAETGVSLTRNEYYWGGTVEVDRVEAVLIKDASTRVMALQSGEIDIATQIEHNDLELLEEKGGFNIQKGPNVRIFMTRLNMGTEYMQIPEFRKALLHAIDQDLMVKEIANGYPAKGPFAPVYDFAHIGKLPHTYNPALARELLDSVGIVDGNGDGVREHNGNNIVLRFILRTGHGASAKNMGVAMQSAFRDIGISMEISQVESFGDIIDNGEFDLVWERWTAAPGLDPQYFLEASFKTEAHGNKGNYSSAVFDNLVKELGRTFDREERIELGRKGVQILLEDVPALFLFHGEGNIVTRENIKGIYRFPTEIYYIDSRVRVE